MDINQIIVYVLIIFAIIGAVDYMAGNKLGVGVKFEEGLHTMGALTISRLWKLEKGWESMSFQRQDITKK